jgi:sortase A
MGLIAVDAYIWVNVDVIFSQAYGNFKLNQQIKSQTARVPENPKPAPLHEYDLIGRVEVPRLGLSAIVREGVDDSVLRTSVGHMPSTALPGAPGNVAIAAHRDTLFRKLRGVHKDDQISFQTADGRTIDYIVDSTKIVKPTDVSVLNSEPGQQSLTLITCYPFDYIGSAPERFIVRARRVNLTAQGLKSTAAGS